MAQHEQPDPGWRKFVMSSLPGPRTQAPARQPLCNAGPMIEAAALTTLPDCRSTRSQRSTWSNICRPAGLEPLSSNACPQLGRSTLIISLTFDAIREAIMEQHRIAERIR